MLFTIAVVGLVAGEVHLTSDRNGTFTIHQRGMRTILRITAVTMLFGVALAVVGVAFLLYAPIIAAVLEAAFWAYFVTTMIGAVLLLSSRQRGTSLTEVGPETPAGTRWVVSSLAQRPGTRWSALEAVLARITSLPSGSVAVAVAATARLQHVYEKRGGFTKGDHLRVFRVIP